jgi:ADP-heptose:LPS heptosyltransferase/glycosyltransferase involved in cell wall biosynthesis
MKVLIIQQKMIGDVLTSSIICELIKKKHPNYKVHYLVNSNTKPVIENNPFIDELIIFTPSYRENKIKLFKFLLSVRKQNYDIVIDAYSKLESNLITLFSGAETKISYSKHYSKFIYTDSIIQKAKARTNIGLAIERRLQLLETLNIHSDFSTFPKLYITKEESQKAIDLLASHKVNLSKKTIMISIIGSSKNKTYPLMYMSKIVDYISEQEDCNILFNYIPSQIEDAKKIYTNCLETTKNKIYFDVLGKNLRDFIALVNECDYIIGNDGGAINMAKALNKPSFIIFSPWIKKDIWATFEDDIFHKTVHLKDYMPDLFLKKSESSLKKNSIKLYKYLKPNFIKDSLIDFMQKLDKKDLCKYSMNTSVIKKKHKPISALVITYNEELNIDSLIENINFADEIIIVDSFSKDSTIVKIKEYNHVKVFSRKFINFSEQRNFALSKASNDWVLFIDADERITPNLKNEIIDVINIENNKIVAYEVYREFYYKNKLVRFSGCQTDKVFRLYKTQNISYKKDLMVHEQIAVKGETSTLKHKMKHYSFDSYDEYKNKMTHYAELRAQELFIKKLKPNLYHYYVKPVYRFVNHYIMRLGILDGKKGFIISYLNAYYVKQRYNELDKLYEKK